MSGRREGYQEREGVREEVLERREGVRGRDAAARQVMESQVKAGRQTINHPSNFVSQTAKLGGQYSCSVTLSSTRIYDVLFQKLKG